MEKRRRVWNRLPAVLCLCVLGLVGCGGAREPEAVTVPTLSVSDKGAVTAYIVGSFVDKDGKTKAYYDLEDMMAMAQSEIDEYNAEHPAEEGKPERISLGEATYVAEQDTPGESSQMLLKSVTVPYHYADGKAYAEYNETVFYYGTVAGALEEGYDLNVALHSVKDGEKTLLAAELAAMGKRRILIAETPAMVMLPGKAAYLSEGLSADHKGSVNALEAQGVYYILMK